MKILVFNIYFHPDPTGTGLVVTQLARDLQALGHDVSVVTARSHYGRELEQRGLFPLVKHERVEGIDTWRTWVHVPTRMSTLGRAANYLSHACLAPLAGWRAGSCDVVLAVFPPSWVALAALLVSRLRGVPLVAWVHDSYPDAVLTSGLTRAAWRVPERAVLRSARTVVTVSSGLKQQLLRTTETTSPIDVVANWADVSGIRADADGTAFREKHALGDRFVVMHSGNVGALAGLDVALGAAELLANELPEARLVIVGRGHGLTDLKRRVDERELDNVLFIPTRPRELLSETLAAADLCLTSLDERITVTSVPSKTYTYMAAGRPVIAAVHEDNEVARLVRDADCGLVVRQGQARELADGIVHAASDRERLAEWGRRGRNHVLEHHSREHATRRLAECLESAAARR